MTDGKGAGTMVVVGTQWGDEGKGKVVDYYGEWYDYIVRFQGGNNAGHTIVVGNETFKFHLLPSGIIRKDKTVVIGNGVVLDPGVLLSELESLEKRGVSAAKLLISDRTHIIMPYHKIIDGLEEEAKSRKGLAAGTTRRGIGPCYSDKMSRFGVRVVDLLDQKALEDKLSIAVPIKEKYIQALGGTERLDTAGLLKDHLAFGKLLKPYVADVSAVLYRAMAEGKGILFEGAQGTHLDIDHGIYPYGTSSNTIAAGAATGTGLSPKVIQKVVGIIKAYTSRVGEGPFPTELKDEVGEHLQRVGTEFGTTTGRPRRTGWLDLVMVNYSVRVNGLTSLALMKADVLSGLGTLKVGTGYKTAKGVITDFPADMRLLAECKPIFEELTPWEDPGTEGWDAVATKGWDAMPKALKDYIAFIERKTGVPVGTVSFGPKRHQTVRKDI